MSALKPSLIAGCLLILVISACVARWHRSHAASVRATVSVLGYTGVCSDGVQRFAARSVQDSGKISCAPATSSASAHSEKDTKGPSCEKAISDRFEAIGRDIESSRKNLRTAYNKSMALNFRKGELALLRHWCEEAEHRFWKALWLGEPATGFYQYHWGETLSRLREAETALQAWAQEAEITKLQTTYSATD